ncbi:MAG: NADPH-dependent F420 reductase [Paracoccaceae bacterium]
MKLAIIGPGAVGQAILKALSGQGHEIWLGTRRPEDPELQALGAQLASPAQAASAAEVVFLAVPWAAAEAAVGDLGDLGDRILVDCTNPLGMVDGQLGLLLGHKTSGAEQIAGWATGGRVVKALNQIGAETMGDPAQLPHTPVMFMAGDDDAAKVAVAKLLVQMGFQAEDAGNLQAARLLEPFAMVWINQAILRGKGRSWGFAAVSV